MSEKRCVVVAAGDLCGRRIGARPGDLVIAADAGYKYCLEQGIKWDVLVGDFDSAPRPDYDGDVVALNVQKDVTDTWQALDIAAERGCGEIHLYAASGGRIDHTVANIQMIAAHAKAGRRVYMYCDRMILTAVCGGGIVCPKPLFDESGITDPSKEPYLSVFAFGGEAKGVDISGAFYTLKGGSLAPEFPLGVSNWFLKDADAAEISVSDGTLIVIWQDIV